MSDAAERMNLSEVQATFDRSPFIRTLGLAAKDLDYDRQELTVIMPLNPTLERRAGTKQFHGGPIASFIDTIGDFAIGMMLGGGVPTINIRIDYLKPAVGDELTGKATVRRHGRTVTVVDIDVWDQRDSLVAVGRGTYASQKG